MPLLVDVRKFVLINELVDESARTVSEQLTSVSGVDSDINITGLSFIDGDDLHRELGTDEQYSAVIDLRSPPYGQVVLTFSETAAARVTEQMTGRPVEGELTDLHESGLRELCNILAGGFIDGWANTFDTTIDVTTPTVEHTTGDEVARKITSHTLPDSLTFVVDATIELKDGRRPLALNFYMIPDVGSFVRLLDRVDAVDAVD